MTNDEFIAALYTVSKNPHVEDILDTLWLATCGRTLSLGFKAPPKPTVTPPPPPPFEDRKKSDDDDEDGEHDTLDSDSTKPDETTQVYPEGREETGEGTVKASPVSLPAGYALTGRLPLARALQPFRQRWPSSRDQELDEEQTAEATAGLGGKLQPVFRPARERWFDVDVVLEDDAAIGLWRDTLRDFTQVLRDTGAFRDVHSWRLRLPADAKEQPLLEAPTGTPMPVRALAGGARRLIFFATHGASDHWLNGVYAQLLADWMHGASVVLLHMLDRSHWKRGALGEPHGLGFLQEPGAATSELRVERFWWAFANDKNDMVRLPVISMAPSEIGAWANMQMARGGRTPVFLLDPKPPPMDPDGVAAINSPREMEQAVALLREQSAPAFRLAVYLSMGPFTLPVARLVQESQLGKDASQQNLVDVLLSGLVVARTPPGADVDPNDLYYEFEPAARAVLLRSLRNADTKRIANALEEQVSKYIEQIYGRAITFRALVADENGRYDLPQWAQSFARLGQTLLGTTGTKSTAAQLVDRFVKANSPEIVAQVARLAADTSAHDALSPEVIESELGKALLEAKLLRQDKDAWTFRNDVQKLLQGMVESVPEMKWVIETIQSLALEFHTGGLEPKELAFEKRDNFYSLESEDDRKDYSHVRHECEWFYKGTVLDYIANGIDPFNRSVPEKKERFRGHIKSVREKTFEWELKDDLECVFALATNLDRRQLEAMIGQPSQFFAVLESRPEKELDELLTRLDSDVFLDIAVKYLDPIDKTFFRRPTTLQRCEDFPSYVRELTKLWLHYSNTALLKRGNKDIEIGFALPKSILNAFGSRFPDIEFRIGHAMKPSREKQELEYTWNISLGDYCEAVSKLRDLVAKMVESRAARPTSEGQTPEAKKLDDHALVVGVAHYASTDLVSIPAVERNTRAFHQWLVSSEGGEVPAQNVSMLISESATASAINAAVRTVAAQSSRRRRLYLYFSGYASVDEHRFSDDRILYAFDSSVNHGGINLSQLLEVIQLAGMFAEIVAIVDVVKASESPIFAPVIPLPVADTGTKVCIAVGQSSGHDPGFTGNVLNGLSGAAMNPSGDITWNSLVHYLDQNAIQPISRLSVSDLVIRHIEPAPIPVHVLANVPSPHGEVHIIDAQGQTIAKARLSEGSCQFLLRPGSYIAYFVEHGIRTPFEVKAGQQEIEINASKLVL